MHRKTRLPPSWRARLVLARAQFADGVRRLARRPGVMQVLMTFAGAAGMLGGGALVGRWCLGLVLIGESAVLAWAGLMRDDGSGLPRRGARTVAEVLEDERYRP